MSQRKLEPEGNATTVWMQPAAEARVPVGPPR
jgi:hypothetical protein